jgi:hypothetical protein
VIAVLIDNFIKSVSAETQAILPSIMMYIALYSILFLHTITRVEPKCLTLVFTPTNCPIQKDIQEEEEIRMAKMVCAIVMPSLYSKYSRTLAVRAQALNA